ncbi:MAG: hypothetical protein ACYSU0_05640, partial [Planctomycetota bacterium]
MDADPAYDGFPATKAVAELPAFEGLARALCRNEPARATGLWGGSAGLVLATLVRSLDRPLLAVTPTPEEADMLEDDLATFLDRHGGYLAPDDPTPRGEVLPLPAYDVLPHETDSPEMPVLSARLTALRLLAEESDPPAVVVAPVAALLQPVPSPEAMRGSELVLTVGEEVGHGYLVQWLHGRALERVPAVAGRGEFAVRGGIVDVFPLYSDSLVTVEGEDRSGERPVRVEFDGEVVASLRAFDPVTQRSLADLTEYRVPGIERARALDPYTFGSPGTVEAHLAPGTLVAVVEPEEVARTAGYYASSVGRAAGHAGGHMGGRTWEAAREGLGRHPVLELSRTASEGG